MKILKIFDIKIQGCSMRRMFHTGYCYIYNQLMIVLRVN